jgi:DNA-binding MarR family transcriptional regulator
MTTADPARCPGGAAPGRDDLGLEGVGFLLGAAHRARRRQWEACLADLGLTAPRAAVLRLVTADPGRGVRYLAGRLGTDPMNAQRIIETLIADGLCELRRDSGDARRRPVYPTASGRRLACRVARRAEEAERALAALLGEAAYRTLTAALRTLAERDAGTRQSPPGPAGRAAGSGRRPA